VIPGGFVVRDQALTGLTDRYLYGDLWGRDLIAAASGRAIIVVVVGDDPDFVITTFPDEPLCLAAERYALDLEALSAAAQAALAAPNRSVTVEIAVRSAA
jgi:hypothetical protein